ncbi:four helix bundle protein [Nitrospira sp. MA-1]|nr:four helix bundle protein [Nitrospira sp. MA-1]
MKNSHKTLNLWNVAQPLVANEYRRSKTYPDQKRFWATNQILGTVVRISSHIAEGAAGQTSTECIQYFHVFQRLGTKPDTQLGIAKRLGWLQKKNGDELENAMSRMDKMPSGLNRHQQSSRPSRVILHERKILSTFAKESNNGG